MYEEADDHYIAGSGSGYYDTTESDAGTYLDDVDEADGAPPVVVEEPEFLKND
jgi:hypothetical protein